MKNMNFLFFGITVANNDLYAKQSGMESQASQTIFNQKKGRWQIVGTLFDGSSGVTNLI